MAHQRSWVEWLQVGDRNTSFFHVRAAARKRTNRIKSLAHTFYKDMFTSEPCIDANNVLESIPACIDQPINDELCRPYSDEEIKDALFHMGPTKAPRPDGFPAMFNQKHWAMLRGDICNAARAFLSGDDVPEGLWNTMIVLIPKKLNLERLTNFWPISLCNVLYKIASKVLANRLKGVLPSITAEEQSAFVPRRLITDNVMIAYECMHTIRRQQAKSPVFALRINMMKAYDRVEWRYLEGSYKKWGLSRPGSTV
jgi:hypothetical protein